jgi:membrane protease YdiL (CAAX protease family)
MAATSSPEGVRYSDVSLSEAARPIRPLEQLRLPVLLALFLVPGALATVAFFVIAPFVEAAGFPPIAALLVAILIVLLPIELGLILRAGQGNAQRIRSVVPYRRPLPLRDWLWLVPVLVVAAFVGFGLSMAFEPAVIAALFGWLPDWFVRPIDPDGVGKYSDEAWLVTLAAYFVLNGFAGPIVEELYFRGYLLPRMEWMGRWAPLVNASLFSLYHFWSPWQLVGRILGFGPTVYAVRWKENVYLGMVVHCTLNTIGVTLVASLVLSR